MKGYLFEYEVVTTTARDADIRYTCRVYKPGSGVFELFRETTDEQRMQYPLTLLDEAHELFKDALGRTNAQIYEQAEEIRKLQKGTPAIGSAKSDFDFKDINDLFEKEGKGSHMLVLDFEPSDMEPHKYLKPGTTDDYGSFWLWKHKLTGVKVRRYQTPSGKSYDTGALSKNLMFMKRGHPEAYARAKHILLLNGNYKPQVAENGQAPLTREERLGQQVCFLNCLFLLKST